MRLISKEKEKYSPVKYLISLKNLRVFNRNVIGNEDFFIAIGGLFTISYHYLDSKGEYEKLSF